ncbi:MAG TPA: hypothetical protein PKD54_00920 [Pirellulaceae bacterium]|nr:hypothetical protein [Pirellulaceae bacterium]
MIRLSKVGIVAVTWILAGLFPTAAQEFTFPLPEAHHRIYVSGSETTAWQTGGYDVLHLTQVRIEQGPFQASAREGVILMERVPDPIDLSEGVGMPQSFFGADDSRNSNAVPARPPRKVLVYLEGDVEVQRSRPAIEPDANQGWRSTSDRLIDQVFLIRLFTKEEVALPQSIAGLAGLEPPAFHRALQQLQTGAEVQPVQYVQGPGFGPQVISPITGQVQAAPRPMNNAELYRPPVQTEPLQAGSPASAPRQTSRGRMQVDITARDAVMDLNLQIQTNPANPNERIFWATGGVRVSIDSTEINQMEAFRGDRQRAIVMLADNVVAWQTTNYAGDSVWEIYLEGNVVFTKGNRIIKAEQIYYHVNDQRGTILHADMLTAVPRYQGLVRMKADVVQQVDENNLQAYGAAFTSSRMGVPRYWLQSQSLELNRVETPQIDPRTGAPLVDWQTGELQVGEDYFATGRNNFVYVNDRPVFYWPRFQANLNDPTLYLERIRVSNDRILGFQVLTAWNLHQILGIRNRPERTTWLGNVDYLSNRGLGLGSESDYQRDGYFGIPGEVEGFYRSWFIQDRGLDTLGRGRINMTPEEERRGNFWLRHRHQFYPGFQLRAELGYITDRNFLEQFYERRWDTEKDQTTGIWLERNIGTQSYHLIADYQINPFFTQTSWLPRLDHFVLGQPLFGNRVIWNAHSHAGYGRFRIADAPLDPIDLGPFDWTAWEANDATGVRAGTRHELQLPLQLGPTKIVPYALGDVTYWQEDLNQNDLLRGFGQVGLRTSLPFWRVDPTIQSTLWNVNGLAHKVTYEADFLYADASQDLDRLPLFDPLDDDSQEAFRHRLAFNTFGVPIGMDVPLQYDERYFALRRGMPGWVTAGSAEIADDMMALRLGVRQRWQTKRGLTGQERIIDWITLDVGTSFFPRADRDNFGADFGLTNYNFQWHVGDRVSLVSDGFFEFYSQGLRTASVGIHFNRPEMGSLLLSYRMIEGPISSNLISASTVYRMSDKWGIRGTTSIDLGEAGTLGQSLSVIYIGESFLWRLGAFGDATKGNFGFQFGLEPRFLLKPRLFRPGGVALAPASARYLE